MEEVWRRGTPATVRAVMEALNGRAGRERAYTTYLTIMRRLDAKGLLSRERVGRSDVYSPALSRDEYVLARAREEVRALVAEYGDVALVQFARHVEGLDERRRRRLRRLARSG